MSFIVVDVESDGPIPNKYSMISFGAVVVEDDENLPKTFYGKVKPISDIWIPEALAISKISREEHLKYDDPKKVMQEFSDWITKNSKGRPIFLSDNNGYDWMFICWYFHTYIGSNPFGHSSMNLNSLYKGTERNMKKNIRHLKKTKHTHNPVDDAKGNAEAFLAFKKVFKLNIPV